LSNHRPWSLLAHVLKIAGFVLMAAGLLGFLLSRDARRAPLNAQQLGLLAVDEKQLHASFVIAGLDNSYPAGRSQPVYDESGEFVCWRQSGEPAAAGTHTDAIAFVQARGSDVLLVMLPSDLLIGAGETRLKEVYALHGADGLRRQVGELLGIPVDYHAIIDLAIFEQSVDALGGVAVNVSDPIRRTDCEAEFTIDLQPGLQVLNGREAAYFVRYRDLPRGEMDRLDNMKLLAYGLLERLRELNLRGVSRLPRLLDTFPSEVETNASPALLRRLLPHLGSLRLQQAATLPVVEVARGEVVGLEADAVTVEQFLAALFGGTPRSFQVPPDLDLIITNRSGRDRLGEWYRSRLLMLGVPAERLLLRDGDEEAAPTRLVTTADNWSEARFYSELMHLGRQQVDRFSPVDGRQIGLELVLGPDAPR
jgi:LCP family protein required for cell wall assembly